MVPLIVKYQIKRHHSPFEVMPFDVVLYKIQ